MSKMTTIVSFWWLNVLCPDQTPTWLQSQLTCRLLLDLLDHPVTPELGPS